MWPLWPVTWDWRWCVISSWMPKSLCVIGQAVLSFPHEAELQPPFSGQGTWVSGMLLCCYTYQPLRSKGEDGSVHCSITFPHTHSGWWTRFEVGGDSKQGSSETPCPVTLVCPSASIRWQLFHKGSILFHQLSVRIMISYSGQAWTIFFSCLLAF